MNSTQTPLPPERAGTTRKLHLKDQHTDLEVYATLSRYPDGRLGELLLFSNRTGSMEHGLLHTVGVLVSLLFQAGVAPTKVIEKMEHVTFEPAGFTGEPDIPTASSIVDYVASFMRQQLEPKPPQEGE